MNKDYQLRAAINQKLIEMGERERRVSSSSSSLSSSSSSRGAKSHQSLIMSPVCLQAEGAAQGQTGGVWLEGPAESSLQR